MKDAAACSNMIAHIKNGSLSAAFFVDVTIAFLSGDGISEEKRRQPAF